MGRWIASSCYIISLPRGDALNVLPDRAELGGTIRSFDDAVFATIARRVTAIVEQTAAALGATGRVEIDTKYPQLVNHAANAAEVARVAAAVLGPDKVSDDGVPLLGGEVGARAARAARAAARAMGERRARERGRLSLQAEPE